MLRLTPRSEEPAQRQEPSAAEGASATDGSPLGHVLGTALPKSIGGHGPHAG